jgi:hypothetical protein
MAETGNNRVTQKIIDQNVRLIVNDANAKTNLALS